MEKAVSRLEKAVEKTDTPSSSDLGGEFPIMDLVSEEIGALQVSMEGIGLMFEAKKVGIGLVSFTLIYSRIKKIYNYSRSLLS